RGLKQDLVAKGITDADVAPVPRGGRGLKLAIFAMLAGIKLVAPVPRGGRGLKPSLTAGGAPGQG
ncbi:MAG: hypothetical protein WAT12_16665, partial [Candidatus Nitrotoga sp.]